VTLSGGESIKINNNLTKPLAYIPQYLSISCFWSAVIDTATLNPLFPARDYLPVHYVHKNYFK